MTVSELLKALRNANPEVTVLFMEATVDTRNAVRVHDMVNAWRDWANRLQRAAGKHEIFKPIDRVLAETARAPDGEEPYLYKVALLAGM
jgi:hypothetical protein